MNQKNLLEVDWSKIPAPTDDGAATEVTSFYDWSSIDPKWREAGIFPVISEGALRATLGILDRTLRRGYSGA